MGDALDDAPMNNPDAADMTVTFGENTGNDVQNVTHDTYISSDEGAFNFGATDDIRIERDQGARGLIRFDVSQLSPASTVLSARIQFYVETSTAAATISFHAVSEAWDEGTADGANGVANFTFRQGVIPWSLLGASAPASIGGVLGTFPGTANGPIDVDLPASLVQDWVTTPANNHGLLLASNSDQTVRLVSSDGNNNMRPVLTVTYE